MKTLIFDEAQDAAIRKWTADDGGKAAPVAIAAGIYAGYSGLPEAVLGRVPGLAAEIERLGVSSVDLDLAEAGWE